MDATAKYRAAGAHLISGLFGLMAVFLGVGWLKGGGDLVAVPHTLIVFSLVVLTPLAMHRNWVSRGDFVDTHIEAACRFLTGLALATVVVIGLPAAVSWLLPAGAGWWSNLMALPYIGALVIPVTWSFMAVRAAIMAFRGIDTPFPQWLLPETVSLR